VKPHSCQLYLPIGDELASTIIRINHAFIGNTCKPLSIDVILCL
jgi:hypothetical protein